MTRAAGGRTLCFAFVMYTHHLKCAGPISGSSCVLANTRVFVVALCSRFECVLLTFVSCAPCNPSECAELECACIGFIVCASSFAVCAHCLCNRLDLCKRLCNGRDSAIAIRSVSHWREHCCWSIAYCCASALTSLKAVQALSSCQRCKEASRTF